MSLNMSDHSEQINLDPGMLKSLSAAYAGYAGIMEQGQQYDVAASCYTIAGMYATVFDQNGSRKLLRDAARVFRRDNDSYWKLLAVCALDTSNLLEADSRFTPLPDPRDLYHALIGQFYLYSRRESNYLRELIKYITDSPVLLATSVSRAGIPLRTYVSIITATIQNAGYRDIEQDILPDFERLFEKNQEQFQLMQAHKIHWNDQIGLIPFDPDFLAPVLCIFSELRSAEIALRLRQTFQNSRLTTIFDVAADMIQLRPPRQKE